MDTVPQHVLVVGGTRGIGGALVEVLLGQGVRVTYVGRTPGLHPEHVLGTFVQSDLSTLRACTELAARLEGLDFDSVVFCVGRLNLPQVERNTEGVELDLAVSYMSRFILLKHFGTHHASLFPKLKLALVFGSPGSNNFVDNVNDLNFEDRAYQQVAAHTNTVVLNEALVYEAARRFPQLEVYGMNPGYLATGIRDAVHGGDGNWFGWAMETAIRAFNPSPKEYVTRTVVPLLLKPQSSPPFVPVSLSQSGEELGCMGWAASEANRLRAWEASEELLQRVQLIDTPPRQVAPLPPVEGPPSPTDERQE
ncbi:hypothetical protein BASA81_007963 [Batrachochytrium salamandrivorans]|nr:hypothetical protein BASA81_007963 [Batrachochytrium salamandrivorans]